MPEDFEANEVMDETPAKAKAKKGKSMLLIVGIPVVLVSIVAAYILVVGVFLPLMSEKEITSDTGTKETKKTKFGVPFLIEDLTINIPTDEKRNRYLVTDIGFECKNQKTYNEMNTRLVQIKDIVIGTIMSKRLEQLLNNKFIEDTLKTELRDKVNAVLMGGSVLNVYLSERVIN